MSGLFELLLGAFGGCAEDMAERSGGRVEEERFSVRVVSNALLSTSRAYASP